jgi:hypothetical protein
MASSFCHSISPVLRRHRPRRGDGGVPSGLVSGQGPGPRRPAGSRGSGHRRGRGTWRAPGHHRRLGSGRPIHSRARERYLLLPRAGGGLRGDGATGEPQGEPRRALRLRPAGGGERIHHRQGPERLPGPRDLHRHQDGDAAPGRPAGGHGRHPAADPGPAHDQHGRRRALRARHHPAPGGEQSRPADHPRQQHLGGLLRRRRAGRRAVLPRPVQSRSRRGPEGTERHDLRAARRRRRHQPGDQGGRVQRAAGSRPSGWLV